MAPAALARAWRALPPVARCLAALDAAADEGGVEAAAAALLADAEWVGTTLAMLAAAARADPGFASPFPPLADALQQGLVLIDDAKVTIALSVVGVDALAARKAAADGRGTIGFDGGIALYRLLDGGGATIGWWEGPAIDADFDAGADPRCRRVATEALADGGWLRVDGRRQAFIVEHATRDLVMLHALVKPGRAAIGVQYDASTCGFAGATATDPAASHAQILMTLVALAGHDDAAAAIAPWLDHPAFFVRWHAARALLAADRRAGRAAVRALAGDPHRDVRDAARAAAARWDAAACPA